jgi:hypothetical protein
MNVLDDAYAGLITSLPLLSDPNSVSTELQSCHLSPGEHHTFIHIPAASPLEPAALSVNPVKDIWRGLETSILQLLDH